MENGQGLNLLPVQIKRGKRQGLTLLNIVDPVCDHLSLVNLTRLYSVAIIFFSTYNLSN
jgi:hypothetical protein